MFVSWLSNTVILLLVAKGAELTEGFLYETKPLDWGNRLLALLGQNWQTKNVLFSGSRETLFFWSLVEMKVYAPGTQQRYRLIQLLYSSLTFPLGNKEREPRKGGCEFCINRRRRQLCCCTVCRQKLRTCSGIFRHARCRWHGTLLLSQNYRGTSNIYFEDDAF